jgi:hypothetical protein
MESLASIYSLESWNKKSDFVITVDFEELKLKSWRKDHVAYLDLKAMPRS